MEAMKQGQYAPLSVAQMAVILYAAEKGYLDPVPLAKVVSFEQALHSFMKANHADLLKEINQEKALTDAIDAALFKALEQFKATQTW